MTIEQSSTIYRVGEEIKHEEYSADGIKSNTPGTKEIIAVIKKSQQVVYKDRRAHV